MRRLAVPVVAVAVAAMMAACGPASPGDDATGAATPSSSSAAPLSPSELPTLPTPTAPPSTPTDVIPSGVLAGRVTALTDGCTEVTTDDGVAWSLVGAVPDGLVVGDTVTAKVEELGTHDAPCGDGMPARIVSLRIVQ
ncbi:hypothetical protein [Demequina gelatinilytica]|uniref:hypothetical protein n=1 Tax=Demequina gelatinilytica TaxID=1638980 RepID=UPI000AFB9C2C|nr:hypothetical protein [Demequina gelatinilytica]